MDPSKLAQAVARSMFSRDRASQSLGMHLLEVRAGYARMSLTVRPEMLNGHQVCHGGFIFTLADSAFAFACNSYNLTTVASGATVRLMRA